eukprot:127789_1
MCSAISDSSFMDRINHKQGRMQHRRSKYLEDNIPAKINFAQIDLDIVDDEIVEEEDSINDEETPTPTNISINNTNINSINGINGMILKLDDDDDDDDSEIKEIEIDNNKRDSVSNVWFKHNVSKRYEETTKMINTMLGFNNNEGWDFDNQCVNIYHEQCNNINYTKLVPTLKDVLYPTILSKIDLPLTSKQKNYVIGVKYNISNLIKDHYIKDQNDYEIELVFDNDTTVKLAIDDLMLQIESRKEHEKYLDLLLNDLDVNCCILKICGREEYLKNDKKSNNIKIISLSYIRHKIRQNHGQSNEYKQQMYNISFVLIYDNKLCEYDNKKYKPYSLKSGCDNNNNNNDNDKLPYQRDGYNCIGKIIKSTINDGKIKESMKRMNDEISNEILYVQKKIPSCFNAGACTSVAVNTPTFSKILGNMNGDNEQNQVENIDWNSVENKVVRLSEFEHEIIFNIKSLKNLIICPRIREKKNNKHNPYFTYILRIELMFGAEVFEECSWDINIPITMI